MEILDDLTKKWQKKSQLEHIKDLPDTYIGSIVMETANQWIIKKSINHNQNCDDTDTDNTNGNTFDKILNSQDNMENGKEYAKEDARENKNDDKEYKIINKEIEYVPGLRSIIEEILVNAFDNMNRVNQKIAVEKKRLKKVSYIKVWTDMKTGQISIENDGEEIGRAHV